MFDEIFAKTFEQTQSAMAPVVKANRLYVANVEKLVSFQMATLQSYVDLGLSQMKAAVEITDAKGLQGYVNGQVELAGNLRQKLLDDAKALTDLGNGFKAEFTKLAEETVAELTPKAVKAAAPRKAAA